MTDSKDIAPESTAARVALWRALHLELDGAPPILADDVGLKLLDPPDDWRERGDMDPVFTRAFRASIVARARFIEDLVLAQMKQGVTQYVILGAGLDSFAQRHPELAASLTIFEVDRPGPQRWKHDRLIALGYGVQDWLHFVPVDFEAGQSWRDALLQHGFDASRPAVIVSTGVSMYLTREANAATLREVSSFAPGSTLAMTFLLPLEMADPEVRPGLEMAEKGARASGTPFISFFTPQDMMAFARENGFRHATHVSAAALTERYFANREDGLRPPSNAEELLIATT
ncbi:SAM-dependent methyltransferase [Pandoraea fibrosis]|uniref:S-adenosyl-L-methionine-dependent methyltransferase n=1 Tax=Pandoraea fibrosis TaxID=1891094 RepID=A0ABX6HK73_9BURK|nr:class I SAM-dependent methyltransferase [Pandoraea fibrosis]QHE90434.1 SAM-dependent methyltransferase [Pandoraea fibrosis]QHF11266.1 SAM-dependent methyltransferase [Pandoraea fibrosis]